MPTPLEMLTWGMMLASAAGLWRRRGGDAALRKAQDQILINLQVERNLQA